MLHIWLPSQNSHLYVWLDSYKLWQKYESWQDVTNNHSKTEVCLYFPSRHIMQIESDLPTAHLKQLGEVGKQYLFEDISLTSVEQLRVRQETQNNHHYLYACSTIEIEQWVNSASLVGINIQCLLPDFLLLPHQAQTESNLSETHLYLYHDKDTSLLRESKSCGMAVSYIPAIVDQLKSADTLSILTANKSIHNIEADSSHEIEELTKILSEHQITINLEALKLELVPQAHRHPLNFMVKQSKHQLSPYLKVSALIVGLALITQIIADGISWQQHTSALQATSVATSQQYKAWFPENRLNSRTSVQAQLEPMLRNNQLNQNDGLSVLARISPLIQQSNVKANSFVANDKSLKLKLVSHNRGELDTFINKLQQQGVTAEIGAISNQEVSGEKGGTQVVGEVTITESS